MWLFLVPGVILVGVGLVWTLQGLNVLGGSVMSGSTVWAVIGPIVLVVGLVLIGVSLSISRETSPTAVIRRQAQLAAATAAWIASSVTCG